MPVWISDFIHAWYNLVYPAVLGGMIYFLIADADHAIWRESRWKHPEAIAYGTVVLLFALDFIWGKKLYECAAGDIKGWILPWAVVLLEFAIITSLIVAFIWVRNGSLYFHALTAFIACSIVVIGIVSGREALCSLGGGILLFEIAIAQVFAWKLPERCALGSLILALIAGAYYLGTRFYASPEHWANRRISVSGSVYGCAQGAVQSESNCGVPAR